MSFSVVFHPKVYKDIQEAIDWYNSRQIGLGDRFLHELKSCIKSLSSNAFHYAVRYGNVRCMPLKKFPFLIHYRIEKDKNRVFVEAVFSTYRNPEIWEERT